MAAERVSNYNWFSFFFLLEFCSWKCLFSFHTYCSIDCFSNAGDVYLKYISCLINVYNIFSLYYSSLQWYSAIEVVYAENSERCSKNEKEDVEGDLLVISHIIYNVHNFCTLSVSFFFLISVVMQCRQVTTWTLFGLWSDSKKIVEWLALKIHVVVCVMSLS